MSMRSFPLTRTHSHPLAMPMFAVIPAVLGMLVWRPHGWLGCLLLLPLLYGLASGYGQRLAVMSGYYIGALWTLPDTFNAFWPSWSPWAGIGGLAGAVLLLLLPWMLLSPAWFWLKPPHSGGCHGFWRDKASSKFAPQVAWIETLGRNEAALNALRFFGGLLATAIPPLGAVGMVSPLTSAGIWFPGMGITGLLLTLVGLSLIAAVGTILRKTIFASRKNPAMPSLSGPGARSDMPRHLTSHGLAVACVALILLSVYTNVTEQPVHRARSWVSVPTRIPSARGKMSAADWARRQIFLSRLAVLAINSHPDHTHILFPEDVAGVFARNFLTVWYWSAATKLAAEHHDTLLLGAEDAGPHDTYTDSLNLMGFHSGTISASQPAPISEWRPWATSGASASWWRFGPWKVGPTPVALAMCYEQTLVWPLAWDFMGRPSPRIILAPSNHGWAQRGAAETGTQRLAIWAWGRLYGVPVVAADNAPA